MDSKISSLRAQDGRYPFSPEVSISRGMKDLWPVQRTKVRSLLAVRLIPPKGHVAHVLGTTITVRVPAYYSSGRSIEAQPIFRRVE